MLGSAPDQVLELVLGLVELHKLHVGSLFKPGQAPLDGIPSFYPVNCTSQLGVISELADPPVCVINKDIDVGVTRDRHGNMYVINLIQKQMFNLDKIRVVSYLLVDFGQL